MPDHQPQQAPHTIDGFAPSGGFPGFHRPDANYLYTPNQFFDLCVARCSRGTVRLVGYMLRHLIGWTDKNGNPLYDKVEVTQRELERRANVGKSSINAALNEAEELGFIQRVRQGHSNRPGEVAVSNAWAIRWDDSGTYADRLEDFRGFYRGEGHRTTVPNQFFDDVLPCEKHAVLKVVAAVIRHTVGFTNRTTGGKVSEAPLSFNALIEYANCGRTSLFRAIPEAVGKNYIRVVSRGHFNPNKLAQEASVYAVSWFQKRDAPKLEPEETGQRPEIGTRGTPRNWNQQRPEIGTRERPEIGTTRNNNEKHLERQQQQSAAAFPWEDEGTNLLVAQGFDPKTAAYLARLRSVENIRRQIEWLPHRNVTSNPVGFLRRAIEEDFGEPADLARQVELEASRRQRIDEANREQARQRHEDEQRPAYLAYLAEQEARLRVEQPDRYRAFTGGRAMDRERVAATFARPDLVSRLLQLHDKEEARLVALAAAFEDALLDFWAWDRNENPNGLGS